MYIRIYLSASWGFDKLSTMILINRLILKEILAERVINCEISNKIIEIYGNGEF